MKRITSIIVAIALIISLIPGIAINASAENEPAIAVSSATGKAGDTVQTSITLINNPGVTSIKIKVSFDETLLTLTDTEIASAISANVQKSKATNGPLTINYFKGDTDYSGEEFAVLTFKIADEAIESKNCEITISYDEDDVFNVQEENIAFKIETGTVNITVAPMTSVELSGALTTPIKNAEDESAFVGTNVDATISWSPELVDNKFAINTTYTATVTVTAKEGYEIAPDASVTGGGLSFTYDEANKAFVATKTFEKTADKELTGIEVTTKPTKTEYVHGETLDTTGMVVTATYDDNSTAPVTDYTVTYSNGNYLKKGDTTATVNFDGKNATVTSLTVGTKELKVTGH